MVVKSKFFKNPWPLLIKNEPREFWKLIDKSLVGKHRVPPEHSSAKMLKILDLFLEFTNLVIRRLLADLAIPNRPAASLSKSLTCAMFSNDCFILTPERLQVRRLGKVRGSGGNLEEPSAQP